MRIAAAAARDPFTPRSPVAGKMRARVSVPTDATEDVAVQAALADANVQKFVEGKSIRKAIYVKGKLVNIVVK